MKTICATLAVFLILGCSKLAGPQEDQMKRDLVGKDFQNPGGWTTITVSSVQALTVQKRLTDKEAKTENVYVQTTLTNQNSMIGPNKFDGILVLHYKHFEQGWQFVSLDVESGRGSE